MNEDSFQNLLLILSLLNKKQGQVKLIKNLMKWDMLPLHYEISS